MAHFMEVSKHTDHFKTQISPRDGEKLIQYYLVNPQFRIFNQMS